MRTLFMVLSFVGSFAVAGRAQEQPAPPAPIVVAVLDLKSVGGADAQASALTTMLTAEVGATAGHRAVSRNELKAVVAHQATSQLMGCESAECMADIGKLVSAQRILTGEVAKLEGAFAVSLTLIDISDGEPRIAARQEAAWRGREDELLLLARPLVQRLLDAEHAADHVGQVEVFTVDGASLIVDGKPAGQTPLPGPLSGLPTGPHVLEVQKEGYLSQRLDIIVARHETTVARADLEEMALMDQPWFWAAAGGVVLVAGGAAVGVTTWAVVSQPKDTVVTLGKPKAP
jgi:hypothetical protein